ncbi:MAG TPA: OmpA family protein [Puia sp.]|nr:OmpA family protein [Puia sp.]
MKICFLIVVTFICSVTQSQNLVANSSFEDANICAEHHDKCAPAAWFSVWRAVYGYFVINSVPAATGSRYINIIIGNSENTHRSYWQTMLLHKLEKGKRYKINMSINGWNREPNLNDIGIYFADSLIFFDVDSFLKRDNHIGFLDAKVKRLKNGWFKLEKEFVATDNNQFLVVGNFSPANYQEIAKKRHPGSLYLCMLIDDVFVTPVEKIACEDCSKNKDSLYSITQRHLRNEIQAVPGDTVTAIAKADKIDTLIINDILFPFSSYTLSSPDTLERFRGIFQRQGIKRIKVTGYTDDIGTEKANQELSRKRAAEIARILSLKFGISSSVIEVEGQGISTEYKDKRKNRRVEIYIYH